MKLMQVPTKLPTTVLSDPRREMDQLKFQTLVAMPVHQRGFFQDIWRTKKRRKAKDETDSERLKLVRAHW